MLLADNQPSYAKACILAKGCMSSKATTDSSEMCICDEVLVTWYMITQAVEAKVLDNLSEQTTAEKGAFKTAQDIKSLRKQGMSSIAEGSAILVRQPCCHALNKQPKTAVECLYPNAIGSLPVHAAYVMRSMHAVSFPGKPLTVQLVFAASTCCCSKHCSMPSAS